MTLLSCFERHVLSPNAQEYLPVKLIWYHLQFSHWPKDDKLSQCANKFFSLKQAVLINANALLDTLENYLRKHEQMYIDDLSNICWFISTEFLNVHCPEPFHSKMKRSILCSVLHTFITSLALIIFCQLKQYTQVYFLLSFTSPFYLNVC